MSKVRNFTTKKIKEILNNPYTRSDNGTDYEYLKDELQNELWKREMRKHEQRTRQEIRAYNMRG